MCMSGGGGGISMGGVASGVVGIFSSIANYNADVEDFNAKEKQWLQNYKNSLSAGRDEEQQLTTKAVQTQGQAQQAQTLYATDGAVKAAEAETSAAGSGVSGNSVDEVIRGIKSGAAQNRYYAQQNADWAAAQIAEEQKGTVDTEENHINSIARPRPPDQSSLFLGIAGAMVGML